MVGGIGKLGVHVAIYHMSRKDLRWQNTTKKILFHFLRPRPPHPSETSGNALEFGTIFACLNNMNVIITLTILVIKPVIRQILRIPNYW